MCVCVINFKTPKLSDLRIGESAKINGCQHFWIYSIAKIVTSYIETNNFSSLYRGWWGGPGFARKLMHLGDHSK